MEIEVQQSESGLVDEKRKEEELENLGPIGFKNVTQVYMKYNDSIL